jgi:glutamate synthase (NADPH) small chain
MGQPKPPCQNPQERLSNTREVSLGFTKKIACDEARRCPQCAEPTCLSGCPLGIDIPGFIRFLREGDAILALERIKKDNPFPAICGRICPAPCESACIFSEENAPISIRALERYAADNGQAKKAKSTVPLNGKSVAIIGSGACAMTASSILLKNGYKVVMLEAANEPGGTLRYGVPEFRLPKDVLEEQFEELKSQGLELQTNILIGRMKPLQDVIRGFDAVLLATGASLPDFALIEGENLVGVYYAEEFLMRLQGASKSDILGPAKTMIKGSQTVVVGSGYAALDAARMARRLGQETSLIFGGLEEEMGIPAEDIREAIDEGVKIMTPYEPLKIGGDAQGYAQAVHCQRLEIIQKNEKDSLSLQPANEPATVLEAQTVILANSQKFNPFLGQVTVGLRTNTQGGFEVNEQSLTSLEKVFSLGSCVSGPMTVVEAIASGKKVAEHIMSYLNP